MTVLACELYRPFGRTGLMVSPLGFGGAPIGLLETDPKAVGRTLQLLLDHGVNVIDTAAMYRGSEAMIGEAINPRRDEFVLVSKCGMADKQIDSPPWSAALIRRSIERSLKRLRTDHLDVILLHSCDLETLKKGEALAAVVAARDAGQVRFVGYSGDNEAAAWAAGAADIAVIQTSVSICDQANIESVLPAAHDAGIGVMAKRPIANAAWKTLDDQYDGYRSYAKPYHERFRDMNMTPASLGLDDMPWPEIALRFTLSIPGVHTAIIGTTRPDHVPANLQAAARGALPHDAVAKIRAALRRADPKGRWTGLT